MWIKAIFSIVEILPLAIRTVEKLFGKGKGIDKKTAVIDLIEDLIVSGETFAGKEIVDQTAFKSGLNMTIDGIVKMLNATVWYKP